MTLLRNRRKLQRRHNLLLAGATLGGLGIAAGGVALTRRSAPISSVRPKALASVGEPNRISSIKPKVKTTTSAVVHIPGLGKTYYQSSPLVERNVRLGKPGGRPRSRKNWNEWDYYRDSNKGAYNLRSTQRFDKGRF